MPGSTKGLIVYNSSGYNTLCYAKMMRSYKRPFSVSQLKHCLRGVFYEPGISRAKEQLKSLAKNGYVLEVSPDQWQITDAGYEQIYISAASYRAQKERYLGKRYVSNATTQIAKIAKSTNIDRFDEEEKILVAMENRMKQVRSKRSGQRAKHRSH